MQCVWKPNALRATFSILSGEITKHVNKKCRGDGENLSLPT